MSFALATALAALAASAPASAQTTPGKSQARELFEEGVALEKKSEWATAAAKFDEAAKIVATAGVRYHQGYAYEMLGKLATALDHYESALTLAREQKKTDVESAALARLEPLRVRVPQLAIRLVTRVEAKVHLDAKDVPQPLLDGKAFRVDPGDHVVTATAPGYKDFAKRFAAREGLSASVDVVLEKTGAHAAAAELQPAAALPVPTPAATPAVPPPEQGPTEPPNEQPRKSIAVPLAVTGAALAFGVGGVVSFVLAGSAQGEAHRSCPTKVSCDEETTRVRTLDALALVGFASAATLGAVSVVLWTSRRTSSAGPSARVVASPGGAAVEGVFW